MPEKYFVEYYDKCLVFIPNGTIRKNENDNIWISYEEIAYTLSNLLDNQVIMIPDTYEQRIGVIFNE